MNSRAASCGELILRPANDGDQKLSNKFLLQKEQAPMKNVYDKFTPEPEGS